MARKTRTSEQPPILKPNPAVVMPDIPLAQLLSFLKESRGAVNWTTVDLMKTLHLGARDSERAIAILQLQGYVNLAGQDGTWLTTAQGDILSGSKFPSYTHESVAGALARLTKRIKTANGDRHSPYKVIKAVAYGDFLIGRERVQAADVGIALAGKKQTTGTASATAKASEREFLKKLRGREPRLALLLYEDWMSARSHRELM